MWMCVRHEWVSCVCDVNICVALSVVEEAQAHALDGEGADEWTSGTTAVAEQTTSVGAEGQASLSYDCYNV